MIPVPPGFAPLATGATVPEGFRPVEEEGEDSFQERGVEQPDGTYIVPTPDGPVHLTAEGKPVRGSAEAQAAKALKTTGSKAFAEESPLMEGAAAVGGARHGAAPDVGAAAAPLLGKDVGASYRALKDVYGQAEAAHPLVSGLAGAVTSLPIGGAGTAAGRVALSGALGAGEEALRTEGDVGATLKGGAAGLAGGVLGEVAGAALNKGVGKLRLLSADAFAARVGQEAAALQDAAASANASVGGRTTAVTNISRQAKIDLLQPNDAELQRIISGAPDASGAVPSDVAQRAAEDLLHPEVQAVTENARANSVGRRTEALKALQDARTAAADANQLNTPAEAQQRARAYFSQSLWQSEIKDRLKRVIGPRFGMSALAMAMGDKEAGSAAAGAIMGAPGMKQMLFNVAKSPRVQKAFADAMAPLLETVGQSVARGAVPGVRELAVHTLNEKALGEPQLVAEQLASRGGLKATLGEAKPVPEEAAALNAPTTPLDRAIHQTLGVTILAAALDAHHTAQDKAISDWLAGKKLAPAGEGPGLPKDVAALASTPEALVDRVSANLGSLATVAPAVHAQALAVAQRQAQHLSQVAARPPPSGPLAPAWVQGAAEKRAVARAVEAVNDPNTLIRRASDGTLTPQDVAHVAAVYPMALQSIRDKALDAALEAHARETPLPPKTKRMLSLLTGVDVDGRLAATASHQAVISGTSRQESAAKPKAARPSQTGLGKLDLASRMKPPGAREEEP